MFDTPHIHEVVPSRPDLRRHRKVADKVTRLPDMILPSRAKFLAQLAPRAARG